MFSMPFHCVRDLKSQDQQIDSKMMVESKAVAVVTLLMVWQRIKSSQSHRMKKKSAIFNELHYKVDVIVFLGSGNVNQNNKRATNQM